MVWNCQYIQCGLLLAHTHTCYIMARLKYNITTSRHWCKYRLHTRLRTHIKSCYQHKGICGCNVWDMPWHIHVYIPRNFLDVIHRQFRPSIPWVETRSILCFLQALRLQLHSSWSVIDSFSLFNAHYKHVWTPTLTDHAARCQIWNTDKQLNLLCHSQKRQKILTGEILSAISLNLKFLWLKSHKPWGL